MANDSHLSQPTKGNEDPPINAHKRLALGERYNGQSNPNGAPKASTKNLVANNQGKTY